MNIPTVTLETITPQIAAEWLKGNTTNRRLVYNHLERMTSEMKDDEWKITGDTIKFNGDRLMDGQHRLEAVVRSGVTIQCFVARSVETDAFGVIDTGRSRAAGDVLSSYGYKNVFLSGSSARTIWHIERKDAGFNVTVTNAAILATMKRHPELTNFISEASAHNFAKNSATCSSLYWIYRCSPTRGDEFIDQFLRGVELKATSPVHVIRERVISDHALRATKVGKRILIAMIFRAWEAWMAGRPMAVAKATRPSNEDFPWPKGGPYVV